MADGSARAEAPVEYVVRSSFVGGGEGVGMDVESDDGLGVNLVRRTGP